MARVINLTVVQDGNEDILDAFEYAETALGEGLILGYSVTASMAEDNIEILVPEENEAVVRAALVALKYQIV